MDESLRLRQAILDFMRRPGYRPATADELQRLLRIDKPRRHAFQRTLRDLVQDDEIVRVNRDRYAAAGKPVVPGRGGRGAR
ncbi:MAG TPA: hypothetical protein VGQ67_04850, partial [Candidatus Polarisedimenticolia bacterium]|nr:hypothetical protein [Candidatus Polarisedimenticolia bacterium]